MDELLDIIADFLRDVGDSLESLIRKIRDTISELIKDIGDALLDIVNFIGDAISNIFNGIADALSNIFDSIVGGIQTIVSNVVEFINDMIDSIVDQIVSFVDSAVQIINEIFTNVVDKIVELTNETVALFVDFFDTVTQEIQDLIDSVVLFFEGIFNTIQNGINTIIDTASGVVQTIVDGIERFIEEVIGEVGNTIRDLLETISNIPDVLREFASSLVQSAVENVKTPIDGLPLKLIADIAETVSGEPLQQADLLNLNMLDMVFGQSPVIQSPETMREFVAKMMPENAVLKAIVTLIVSPFMIIQTLGGIASANSQILLQEHALVNPYRIMEPSDVISQLHAGLISESFAVEQLRKTGYTESVSRGLIKIGEFVPPAGELVAWKLRNLITTDYFNESLKRQGWTDKDIGTLTQASFFIPPVQDLITMAVREVFTPDVAREFGQFEDFPEEFVEQAAKQGVSEEWALRYWGAHWSLPSVQMGFEMLHRGVINQEELNLLLRSADVMPFWRDKLTQISFSPLTRVDIRRMHKEGVLTVEDVNKAYHDIGYDDLNAERLTEFTVKINETDEDVDPQEITDLTRSNIINFFRDGLLNQTDTLELLQATGVSLAAAQLFVTSIELEQEAITRRENADLIIEQAKAGVIDFDEAQDALGRLGLETLEMQRALNELEREQTRLNKIPPKGDLDKMLKARIIDVREYKRNLNLLGFSDLWAERYVKLNRSRADATEDETGDS